MNDDSAEAGQPVAAKGELIGTEVDGRFRVVERIGGGGMGSIFRVEHMALGREFALKVLKTELSDDRTMVERFRREARAAASLSSEHVVAIVDTGSLPDHRPYYVMDLLRGSDLRRLLRAQGTLTPARVANLGIDICRGLSAAHAVGLVHRDLKPENLFVTRGDDGRDVCKILDFGVVKGSEHGSTRPGSLVGTVRYMAPEQVGLDAPIGPLADLHAVGVILYECLCGTTPFDGDTTERVLYGIMNATPIPLAERCPELPPEFAAAVTRAFARRPEERLPSARSLAEALLPFAVGRQASPAESFGIEVSTEPHVSNALHDTPVLDEPSGQRLPIRHEPGSTPFPWRVALGALAVGASVAGTAVGLLELGRAQPTDPVRPAATGDQPPARTTEPQTTWQPKPAIPVASPAASGTPASPEALSTAPRGTRTPRLPPSAPSLRGLPPNPSFDPANPYAQ
ncbi:MAG TPA: protein kinase [Polyangiaceae bacterium]|nr:protein kinase [Polyangiaceae bacterium]